MILPTVCPTGRTKRLHDTIVGLTSRTDQSDRPIGPTIVQCKRPVTFSMFALGNSLFACGVRSACERSFEEAHGETEVGRGLLAPEPRPLAPRTHPAVTQTEPQLNQQPPQELFCLKMDNSCCYARYSCGNNCNVVKLVQECKFFKTHFLAFYRNSSPRTLRFLGKRLQASARVKKRTAASAQIDLVPSLPLYERVKDYRVSFLFSGHRIKMSKCLDKCTPLLFSE